MQWATSAEASGRMMVEPTALFHLFCSVFSGRYFDRRAAMTACLTDRLWDIGDIVKLIDGWEAGEA